MKKLISCFAIAVILTQSAFGWNAQDMGNSIMSSIQSAGKSSSVETKFFLPGSEIGLGIFVGCLIFCPIAVGGTGAALYEGTKVSDKANEYFKKNPIEWIKIYSPNRIKNMQNGGRTKPKIKTAQIELSPIKLAVFREMGAKKLKQMYGVGYRFGGIGRSGKSFSETNMKKMFKRIRMR